MDPMAATKMPAAIRIMISLPRTTTTHLAIAVDEDMVVEKEIIIDKPHQLKANRLFDASTELITIYLL